MPFKESTRPYTVKVFTVTHICDWLLHTAMILNAQVTTNQKKTPDLHATVQLDPCFAAGW